MTPSKLVALFTNVFPLTTANERTAIIFFAFHTTDSSSNEILLDLARDGSGSHAHGMGVGFDHSVHNVHRKQLHNLGREVSNEYVCPRHKH